jgi:hypothetical protein
MKELSFILNELIEDAPQIKEFAVTQTPQMISELLLWNGIESFICFSFSILIFFSLIFVNYKQYLWIKKREGRNFYNEQAEDQVICMINILQVALIFLSVMLFNLNWLKIFLTPRVFLLEYFLEIVK